MTDMHKCAVVGCGFVGASCAFSLVEKRIVQRNGAHRCE